MNTSGSQLICNLKQKISRSRCFILILYTETTKRWSRACCTSFSLSPISWLSQKFSSTPVQPLLWIFASSVSCSLGSHYLWVLLVAVSSVHATCIISLLLTIAQPILFCLSSFPCYAIHLLTPCEISSNFLSKCDHKTSRKQCETYPGRLYLQFPIRGSDVCGIRVLYIWKAIM